MRALNERERKTLRRAGVALSAYLLLFYGVKGWKVLEKKGEVYAERLRDAEVLKLGILREKVKEERLRKLKEASRIDLKALEKESVVGQTSAAIQKAAQTHGIQLGPSRESPGRVAGKELASIQIEGQGTTLGAAQFLHSLESLGYPLVIDGVTLKTTGMKPGEVHLSLSLSVLDFTAWKAPGAGAGGSS